MSFYRSMAAALAAFGLAGAVFADTASPSTNQQAPATIDSAKVIQLADATATPAAQPSSQAAPVTADQEKVDLNKATAKELMKVKGMNSAKARAIVSYRKKHGDFKSLDELKMVKGFKRMKSDNFKQIQDQLTIG